MLPLQRFTLLTGAGLSLAYAVAYGLLAYFVLDALRSVPTLAFLCLVPAAMGALPLLFSDVDQVKLYVAIIYSPWMSTLIVMTVLLAVGREGAFCILVLISPFLALGMLGSLIGWMIAALVTRSRKKRRAAGAAMMALPFLLLPVEPWLTQERVVTVSSSVVVAADAGGVWRQLPEFPTIAEHELPSDVWQSLGVPRPIRATVDRVELGGRRRGEFENGLTFDERIIALEPERRLAFSIDVDPASLRPHSAERHAFEGGYFDFVDAEYTLRPLDGDRVEVTLASRYRLRTSVNFYGELWASWLVADFQEGVLAVLRQRVEAEAEREPLVRASPGAARR